MLCYKEGGGGEKQEKEQEEKTRKPIRKDLLGKIAEMYTLYPQPSNHSSDFTLKKKLSAFVSKTAVPSSFPLLVQNKNRNFEGTFWIGRNPVYFKCLFVEIMRIHYKLSKPFAYTKE